MHKFTKDFCYITNLDRTIWKILQTCDVCQKAKPRVIRVEGEMQHVSYSALLERVLVDLYEPLPPAWNKVSYILVVLDNFSRFIGLYPLCKATAVAVTNRMINNYIQAYGRLKCIVSDHGVQFKSKIWQSRLREIGVPPTMTSVYHPQNPAVCHARTWKNI
jgi:transposase InsO family protein